MFLPLIVKFDRLADINIFIDMKIVHSYDTIQRKFIYTTHILIDHRTDIICNRQDPGYIVLNEPISKVGK